MHILAEGNALSDLINDSRQLTVEPTGLAAQIQWAAMRTRTHSERPDPLGLVFIEHL